MEHAKQILEIKLAELVNHRKEMRNASKRKDKGYNDLFAKWALETTPSIVSIRQALRVLDLQKKRKV